MEVLAETPSTQDAAHELARGKPGLMVIAERQTAGRGRQGRSWVQRGEHGLALTFALDASKLRPEQLSLAAGLAAALATDLQQAPFPEFGLRWPNDVVEPLPKPGGGRKVAGVLVEVRDGLALVGMGVNVSHAEGDFPAELRHAAVSLRQLGSEATRIEIAARLLCELQQLLRLQIDRLAQAWVRRDVLVGSGQAFVHNGARVHGLVESVDPTHEIVVRTGAETVVRLPALTTSLIHG